MSYKTVDVDIELDDVIEYIENCYSDKELQKIKKDVITMTDKAGTRKYSKKWINKYNSRN